MSFPRYPNFKDGGVPGLDALPSHWAVRRFQRCVNVAEGQVNPEVAEYATMPLLAPNHISAGTGVLASLESAAEQSAESGKYFCRAGDVVYSKIRPALRKVCLAPFDCLCSADMYPLRAHSGLTNEFLYWALLSEPFSQAAVLESQRVAMPKVNRESLKALPLPLPPLSEQAAISAFLRRQSDQVDALIAEQERLIELLKEKRQAVISHAVTKGLNPDAPMKPSGIEWLGDVPAHWEVTVLKRVAVVRTGVAKGKDNGKKELISVPYLRVANVQDGYVDLEDVATIEVPEDDVPRYALRSGDVLMNEGGDFDKLGRGCVWDGQIAPCITQNHVFAVRPHGVSSPWLSAFIASSAAQFYFMTQSKQSTNLASISSTNLMLLQVLAPPDSEQQAIVASLAHMTGALDRLMSEAGNAVAFLRERRTALISAAVTGQIDVRGLVDAEVA